jgi:hypothetical protein
MSKFGKKWEIVPSDVEKLLQALKLKHNDAEENDMVEEGSDGKKSEVTLTNQQLQDLDLLQSRKVKSDAGEIKFSCTGLDSGEICANYCSSSLR